MRRLGRPMTLLGGSPVRGGTVLVGIVVAVMVVAAGIVVVAIAGRREQDSMIRRFEAMRAFYAQEAAVQIAVREVLRQQDDDGDGVIGTVAGGVISSGITIGASKGATGLTVSGGDTTLEAQGANGIATRTSAVTLTTANYVPGLYAECFLTASNPTSVNDITWTGTPAMVSVVPNVNMSVPNATAMWQGGPHTNYAIRFRGTVDIPSAGTWTFYNESGDGSVLWVNGTQVVDNDGNHSTQVRSGDIVLPAGPAAIDLKYYTRNASDTIILSWSGPTVASQTVIPPSALTCDPVLAVPPVVGHTSLSLAGATLDGYSSKSGAYGGSNITSGFSVQTNATAASAMNVTVGTLASNALCGVGGTPNTVITTGSGGSISGSKAAATSGVALFWQTPPLESLLVEAGISPVGTLTITSDRRLAFVNLTTANAKMVISGHRVMQVDGGFTIGSNCTIELNADSSLRLYMTGGTLALSSTAQVNANTADPTRFHVFFTSSGLSMTMANSAAFHGYAFNPGGGLAITGGSTPAPTFFGAFHGTTVSTSSTALIRADAAFGSTSAATTVLAAWRQTR